MLTVRLYYDRAAKWRKRGERDSDVPIAEEIQFLTTSAAVAAQHTNEVNYDRRTKEKCHGIIHTASVAAAGVGTGLAQIPGSDNAVLTPIQLTMTIGLGKVFGINLTESAASAAIGSVAASMVGRTVSQFLVGWIPGIGNAINATTAAGLTEFMGWILAEQFDKDCNA